MADFALTDADIDAVDKWLAKLNKKLGKKNKTRFGYVDFLFSYSSEIGIAVTAIDRITGKTLDLTDVDSW